MSVGALPQPHDKISFSINRGPIISEKCAELYASGLSLNEVAQQLGIAKSSVLRNLKSLGASLRPSLNSPAGKIARNRNYQSGHAPYGHAVIAGHLVLDPKEMALVHRMIALWNSGAGICSIAKTLNAKGHRTRAGKVWRHPVVSAILRRELGKNLLVSRVEDKS